MNILRALLGFYCLKHKREKSIGIDYFGGWYYCPQCTDPSTGLPRET